MAQALNIPLLGIIRASSESISLSVVRSLLKGAKVTSEC